MKNDATQQFETGSSLLLSRQTKGWESVFVEQFWHPSLEGNSHHSNEHAIYLALGTQPLYLLTLFNCRVNNWPAKFLFWSTGSAPGLKVNRVYLKVLCSDVQAVAQTVLEALVDDPVIVPAHGTPLVDSGDTERVRSLVEPYSM